MNVSSSPVVVFGGPREDISSRYILDNCIRNLSVSSKEKSKSGLRLCTSASKTVGTFGVVPLKNCTPLNSTSGSGETAWSFGNVNLSLSSL